jgi:hypothetical protein
MNLSKNVKIMEVGAPVSAANNTDDNSDRIDMSGWEGVVFICPVTDCVDGGVATLKVEQNTADSDTGMAALSGASAAATSAANDDLNNKLLIVDVYKPRERYVQAVRTSATQNIAFGSVIAILYSGKLAPVTADASVLTATLAVSPSE